MSRQSVAIAATVVNVHTKRYVRLLLTGFAMGTADLVPGVSGGTVAFLSGVYEELLHCIKLVTGQVLGLIVRRQWREAMLAVPWRFLVPLGAGILTAIFALASLLSMLLREHPVYIWSFFFGLVLASVYVVLKRVGRWNATNLVSFAIAAVVAFLVVGIVPVETPATAPYMFVSGMIAICAMILPGISGSFILLLLGKYQQLLDAVTQRDVVTLAVFAIGAAVGIALFARLLSWLFQRYHDMSIAVLSGIMLGAARKIWPWKETVTTRINSHGEAVPLVERNVLPATYDLTILFAVILFVVAIGLVVYLNKLQIVKERALE